MLLVTAGVLYGLRLDGQATHDGTGAHIDQMSIDVGPHGVAQGVNSNGRPAIGDRDGDALADAEGYDTPDLGDAPGVCGNGFDDDLADPDGDTIPDLADGVADDGCVVPLSPLETCIEIVDNDILDADEDSLVGGQDRAVIDVTVGVHPGPGGGVPADRLMSAWQYFLNWDVDVLDADLQAFNFLILAAGGGQPFTSISADSGGGPLPVRTSPAVAAVADAGPVESGAGVLSRITIEGNQAGLAILTLPLKDIVVPDRDNLVIPIDSVTSAQVAVSKDGADGGVVIGDSPGELFTCPPSGDVSVTSVTVAAPATAQVGSSFIVAGEATLVNGGPMSEVNADAVIDLSRLSRCLPRAGQQHIPLTIPMSESVTIPFVFIVQCFEPSFHSLTSTVTLLIAAIEDTVPANNQLTSDSAVVAITDSMDLKVLSVEVSAPTAQSLCTTCNLEVRGNLHNNGPDGAFSNLEISLILPSDCAASDNPRTLRMDMRDLSRSISFRHQFRVACSQEGTHALSAVVAFPTLLHRTDSEPANNSRTAEAVICNGQIATITGSSGRDHILGTDGRDVVAAKGGDDVIDGRGGNDLICAGSGDDKIEGGDGGDAVFGEGGDDNVAGGDGADNLFGGSGDDKLDGEDGEDALSGGGGWDYCDGGFGLDAAVACERRRSIP